MKKIKYLILSLVAFSFLSSCDDDPQQFEADLANTPYVIGFNSTTTNVPVELGSGVQEFSIPVNLFNGITFTNTPEIVATVTVDPNGTAIQGTEYDFVTTPSQTVTIEAGREFGMMTLSVDTDVLQLEDPVNNPKTIILTLENPSQGYVGEQFKTTTVSFVCTSDLAGDYASNETIDSGAPNTTIEEVGDGEYRIGSMPFIAFGGGGGAPAWIEFTDVCGNLEFGEWVGGTLAVGSGVVNPDGSISFNNLTIYNGNVVDPNDVWFNLGPSTYTPSN